MQAVAGPEQASSSLATQIEVLTRDLDWTLAHCAFVTHATTLEAECDIAHSPLMSVASSHHGFPRTNLAFLGDSAALLATYATFLIDPGSEVELVVNKTQRDVARAAFNVQHIEPLWQMVFRGDLAPLTTAHAITLREDDLPAMHNLATSENVELRFVARHPFDRGPAFGLWEARELVAMGMTHIRIRGAAQIGNIVARNGPQAQTRFTAITGALVKALTHDNLTVFIIVSQNDADALRCLEPLGFVRERPMYRMRCVLETKPPPA